MRTNVNWAMKSQQPINVAWTIETWNNIDSKSVWSWTDGVLRRSCITDKKKDILTDKIVTYWNCVI